MQPSQNMSGVDQAHLDLLVDGELPDDRRRDLLDRIDREPDGWKCCALAFLEGQAWRRAMGSAVSNERPAGFAAPQCSPSAAPVPRRRRARAMLVIASALCAAAFGLGRWSAEQSSLPASLAGMARSPAEGKSSPAVSHQPVADQVRNAPSVAAVPDQDGNVTVSGVLQWSVEENGQTRELAVPVVEGSKLDLQWLLSQPPVIREPIRKELERRGHKVELHRRFITLNLKDGRSVVMPVDQVGVKFAGRVYQ